MKITVHAVRVIVGLLFIFSGLIKAIDPLGLSYKMQEFLELWGMSKFNSWTLLMSVLMNAFEIIAGFALLLGWRIKLFSWLLLLLIVFFTFLTGYAYLSGKFRSCGCFGDCIPITPKTSFLKDLLLLVLIGFLFWKQKLIRPFMPEKATTIAMLIITALSFGIQWYSLTYLPVVDCLPYKKGNNINEKMKMPANAVPDSTVITFVYDKGGQQVEFTADKFPADFNGTTYKLIKRYDKIIRKGKNNQPPIAGFNLSGVSNEDSTQVVLQQPYAVILFCEDFSVPVSKWQKSFSALYAEAKAKNIPAYLVTTQPGEATAKLAGTSFSNIQVLKCDNTAIRTAARTNPCVFVLKQGTILGKWSRHNFGAASKLLNGFSQQPITNTQ
ncbi:MAG: DoxX family protein [Bacteroidota bacterium]|nr:DoxX family protein [Bacteroidota bacterium]